VASWRAQHYTIIIGELLEKALNSRIICIHERAASQW
jgi:hypothetical protein